MTEGALIEAHQTLATIACLAVGAATAGARLRSLLMQGEPPVERRDSDDDEPAAEWKPWRSF